MRAWDGIRHEIFEQPCPRASSQRGSLLASSRDEVFASSAPKPSPRHTSSSASHDSRSTCTGWCRRESAARSFGNCFCSSRCVLAAGAWTHVCCLLASPSAQASPRPSPELIWSRWFAFRFEHIKFVRAHLAVAVERLHQRHEARAGRAAVEGELVHSAGRRRVPLDPVPLALLP